MKPTFCLTGTILCLLAIEARGAEWREAPEVEKIFATRRITATFVALDVATETLRVGNGPRAKTRFIPASTFKIPNTLIGLETGAVTSVDQVLPYGGKPQPYPNWEHDMPLREAMKLSAVPIYQELARRIGLPRMAAAVKAFNYGNHEVGKEVDRFWLSGPLAISAIEQAQFLARLVQGKLPVSPAAVAAVEEITLQEHTDAYDLHFKTGLGFKAEPQIGWVVGWVTTKAGTSTFAFNMNIVGPDDVSKRVPLAKECLAALGLLP